MCLLSYLFPKVFNDSPFWKRFFVLISKRVTDYYCKTTPARVVIFIIRMNTVGYGLITIGYPTLETIITDQSLWISLKWSDTDWKLTALYVILNVILGAAYLITQRYGGDEAKEAHKRQEEQHKEQFNLQQSIKETVDNTHRDIRTLNEFVSSLPSNYQSIFIRSIRNIQHDIENLRFKAALNHLSGIRELAEEYCPKSTYVFAQIEYWEACCLKYSDPIKSVNKYKKAYSLSVGPISKEMVEGYIFALCFENKLEDAQQIANTSLAKEEFSVWRYIPSFLKASNKYSFFEESKITDKSLIEGILSECMLLLQKHNQNVILTQYPIRPQIELGLSYSTFPQWVLYLSYALSDFVSNLYLPFNGDNLSTAKSELLYSLTTTFLEKDAYHELKEILPDVKLYQAFTGFLHDRQNTWISLLRSQLDSCHDVDMAHLFLSYALFQNDQKDEAIQLLKDYSSRRHDLDWTLISMLSAEGKWDEIECQLNTMVENGNIEIPPTGYLVILNLVRFFPDRYSIFAKRFSLAEEQANEIFKKFILFFEGDKTTIDALIKFEPEAPDVFNSFYPIVYEAKGDINTAISKAKNLLPKNGMDSNVIRYAELLEKAGKEKDLLYFLRNTRKKHIFHAPFLFKELFLDNSPLKK